jgi:hypothetical protein
MSGRCDEQDDLTLVYMWARKDADDEIKKLRADNERLREALRQGVAMRAAQRAYFADRSRENLIASKEAERAFDAAARAALKEEKPFEDRWDNA